MNIKGQMLDPREIAERIRQVNDEESARKGGKDNGSGSEGLPISIVIAGIVVLAGLAGIVVVGFVMAGG